MVISTGQKYRGFDITQRVGIPCGADFQSAQSPLRERLLLPLLSRVVRRC